MATLKEKYPDRLVLLYLITEPKYPFSFKERMELLLRVLESRLPMCADEFVAAVITAGKDKVGNDLALTDFLAKNGYPASHEMPRPGLLVEILDSVQSFMLHRVSVVGYEDPVPKLVRRFYAGLPNVISFSANERTAWEKHPLGDWFPTDDPLTIAFSCMCLPTDVYSAANKFELIRTCCDDTVRDFDTFLQGAKYVVRDIATLTDWLYRTQSMRPAAGYLTIRCISAKKKIMGIGEFVVEYLTNTDAKLCALVHETAELFKSKFVHGQAVKYWPSGIAPITTTKEKPMPRIFPSDTVALERRRLVNAIIQSNLSTDTTGQLLGYVAANELDNASELERHLKTFDSISNIDGVMSEVKQRLSNTQDIATVEQVADLLVNIKTYSDVNGARDSNAFLKFLDMHHFYLGISQAALELSERQCRRVVVDRNARLMLLGAMEANFAFYASLTLSAVAGQTAITLSEALTSVEAMRKFVGPWIGTTVWSGEGENPSAIIDIQTADAAVVYVFSHGIHNLGYAITDEVVRGLRTVVSTILADLHEPVIDSAFQRGVLDTVARKRGAPTEQAYLGEQFGYKSFARPVPAPATKTKPFNSVLDLQKKVESYTGVIYPDDHYNVILKAFSKSPINAMHALLELDVTAQILDLSVEQMPKALLHIFSKYPDVGHMDIPKNTQGTLAEQVEFALYWTLLTGHLNGEPKALSPLELETVFKYITSVHYRATLLYIV